MTDDLHPYRTEPDPAFADRLERDLLGRLAAPSNSTDHDLPEDVQILPLADPDRPPVAGELYAPPAPPRSHTGRWLAAAAVLVLVMAAVALLRNAGDDPDGPVDGVPTTTTVPPWTDTPSTGSIVTAEGQGWPEGAAAPPRPELPARPRMPTRGATSTRTRDRSCTPITSSARRSGSSVGTGRSRRTSAARSRTDVSAAGPLRPRA